jgi:hypothetical protein
MYKIIFAIINILLLSPDIVMNLKIYVLGIKDAAVDYSFFDVTQVFVVFPFYIILAPLYLKLVKEEISVRYITIFNVIMFLIHYYLLAKLNLDYELLFLLRLMISVVNIVYILTIKDNTNKKQ